jgi:hypothetical protein
MKQFKSSIEYPLCVDLSLDRLKDQEAFSSKINETYIIYSYATTNKYNILIGLQLSSG